ncbi:hypothetical protein SKAU_G00072980 [Synaphobranchus kaupii]|uniref:Uncharacterized protein n=1 Tax=Synaphobranchus kaupii TaxID=118154 RepID=A0A9Q1G737_SYNKA|nr:hypothetical protein SKAU_G00072980 [Synaphobranchus kaupii]
MSQQGEEQGTEHTALGAPVLSVMLLKAGTPAALVDRRRPASGAGGDMSGPSGGAAPGSTGAGGDARRITRCGVSSPGAAGVTEAGGDPRRGGLTDVSTGGGVGPVRVTGSQTRSGRRGCHDECRYGDVGRQVVVD